MPEVLERETTVYSDIRWTVSDLDRMPDGYRYEIIDGVLYMAATPKWPHAQLVTNLMRILLPRVETLGLEAYAPQTGVYYNERNYLDPDLLILKPDQLPRRGQDHPESGLVAVEVLSHSNLRAPRAAREALFARTGIEEVWYVDHESRSLEVCRCSGTLYEPVTKFQGDAEVTSASLPGIRFSLDELWRKLDA